MIPNGALVYFKGKAALARNDKDRIEIQFSDRTTARVREKDVELLCPGPLASLPKLPANAPETETAWEMTAGQSLSLAELADLLYGQADASSLLASRQVLDDSKLFLIDDQGIRARSSEERLELERREARKAAEGAERAAFLVRARQKQALATDQRFWGEIEALALGNSAKSTVLREIGQTESMEAAQRWLLDCGLWTAYLNPHPARAKHPARAPDLPLVDDDGLPRTDLRQLEAWAIDNAWSHDPDDAISWDGQNLWIHIADPAAGVPPDSPADREAANRAATLYLPEGSIAMLPDAALERFGLGLSAESPALSFRINLDDSGQISEVAIMPSLVRVQRLSYDSADPLLGSGPLAKMAAIAAQRLELRRRNGAVDIDIPETRVWLDGDGKIRIEPISRYQSSGVVREMMVLTSEAAARWAFQRGLPFPYYSQEAPGNRDSLPEGLAGEFAKRRTMKAGKGGVQPHAHQGLGVSMYAQASSPLRRYGDLLAHQQIRAALASEQGLTRPAPLPADELSLRLGLAAAQASAVRKAERDSTQHWTIAWLLEHPEWSGEGIVVQSGADSNLFLPELGLETRVKLPDLPLNSVLPLKFLSADLSNLEIRFAPA
ncbi:MAG: hypothetical protein A2087_04485 [Spirochaetes bacterium GWD1_61_31]|nr:MAG: hypothetical protein A2Y37_06370 [Spirochaetes bacterium GWB1_60_80]OHD33446.1 MAG: hypothetical protein A2004_06175 [Spirochaetes bacterium GWC1_61_12]OHD40576.1 MAG: hypothetical protein A2087_04485 [Spirochaetes bacterium GWD1_61_31]OHD59294.1 MAG: hypothetical protein A2Y32_09850 [Spirochaetes bacterium GWF1_60_12]HAP44589.1 exoribonuclease II [Spirochaetaceae bacterium]